MPFSNHWRTRALARVVSAGTYAAPANLFFGLSTSTPTANGTGIAEPTAASYARVQVANDATQWIVGAASGTRLNQNALNFAQATATWSGGTNFTNVVVYDALTSGNFLAWGALTVPKPVISGDTASFASSAVSWSLV